MKIASEDRQEEAKDEEEQNVGSQDGDSQRARDVEVRMIAQVFWSYWDFIFVDS